MSVCLTLATGSRAGLEAPLQMGYYMIGRRKDCQIRPKSRSVSRRHCLLHHHDGRLRVRDLGSASGTYINDRKVKRKQWQDLCDGDMLRCGKIHFQVTMELERASASSPRDGDVGLSQQNEPQAESMLAGEAWHDVDLAEFDVAGFLESEDEADREARYDMIRAKQVEADPDDFSDSGLDLFEDAFADDDQEPSERELKRRTPSPVAQREPTTDEVRKPQGKKTKDALTKAAKRTPRIAPKKSNRRGGSRGIRGLGLSQFGGLKAGAALLLVALVIAFFGYQVHRFTSGQPVRVIENID